MYGYTYLHVNQRLGRYNMFRRLVRIRSGVWICILVWEFGLSFCFLVSGLRFWFGFRLFSRLGFLIRFWACGLGFWFGFLVRASDLGFLVCTSALAFCSGFLLWLPASGFCFGFLLWVSALGFSFVFLVSVSRFGFPLWGSGFGFGWVACLAFWFGFLVWVFWAGFSVLGFRFCVFSFDFLVWFLVCVSGLASCNVLPYSIIFYCIAHY